MRHGIHRIRRTLWAYCGAALRRESRGLYKGDGGRRHSRETCRFPTLHKDRRDQIGSLYCRLRSYSSAVLFECGLGLSALRAFGFLVRASAFRGFTFTIATASTTTSTTI